MKYLITGLAIGYLVAKAQKIVLRFQVVKMLDTMNKHINDLDVQLKYLNSIQSKSLKTIRSER